MKKEILRMENIYAGDSPPFLLDNFHLSVNEGEIVNLIGLSGAGKTLLLNYFNGSVVLNSGRTIWDRKVFEAGKAFHPDPRLACIGHKSTLVEKMTVAENIFVLSRTKKRGFFIQHRNIIYRTKLLLSEYAPDIKPNMLVDELSQFQRHVVALLRAVENEAKLIIIDDIFQFYGHHEIMLMIKLLMKLKNNNISILYESHNENFIINISDKVVIMRRGMNVRTFYQEDYRSDLATQLLLGNDIPKVVQRSTHKKEECRLEFKNFYCGDNAKNVNLKIHKGEVIGFYDLENKANKEIALSLVGECEIKRGHLYYNEELYIPRDIDYAIKHNIGYVPRSMTHVNLVDNMSFMDNLFLPVMKKTSKYHFLNDYSVLKFLCKEYMEELGVPEKDKYKKVKVFDTYIRKSILFTRWVLFKPQIIVFIEPCSNADILMQNIIYNAIEKLAKQGCSVIITSPYLTDLKPICDRIIITNEDRFIELNINK
ncbi:ATP-binding cassette domain-containing protein [Candidatus Galacturonibacter soehngenii]|uniref:Sugar ABC transporter ATP-binding protein n=1 Tax=Candidatus Galacturonatibacter soehngenii TaxID=2307010 RepID=A0A7V7UBU4_9FIRM|nr:ATP-binding cassette domain-containing protein [Candidatus Galacturonibacter soehngenii]KAB1438453.1 sugar ABC transporter ATP-binding protein [Candidatus Galacturonibacter soehngenii]